MTIRLTSSAFTEGSAIPTTHTCDGEDVSPPLAWSGIPEGTGSIALVADDPDAPRGTWVHWVLYAIPPEVTEIPGGLSDAKEISARAKHGNNDFKRPEYGGPCPPRGKAHRYFFKLYALDGEIELESGARKADLLRAMEGHILAEGRLMGTYRRE